MTFKAQNFRRNKAHGRNRKSMNKLYPIILGVGVLLACSGIAARAEGAAPPDSIAKGKTLFLANCTQCHGHDGKSQVDVVSDATDLTEPQLYRNGSTDKDIETSIRNGRGGVMPAWGPVFNDENSIGHLRNFVKSLWPADKRPN